MSRRRGPRDQGLGPVDDTVWPTRLQARRVVPGVTPRVDGYDLYGDLAEHYRFHEVVLIGLTGTPPDATIGAAFERCLTFLMATSIAEGPTHAASLARLCGGTPASVLGVGAIGQAVASTHLLSRVAPLRAWMENPDHPFPTANIAVDDVERQQVRLFRRGLDAGFQRLPVFGHDPGLIAAVIAVLHACGVRDEQALIVVCTLARMPLTIAEAFSTSPGNFDDYPMNLPAYRYSEEGDGD